jgi:biotin transport system substrate-specific component
MSKTIVFCALFAALSVILSQIAIPIGPVPINLTHISIFMAAGLLGAKYGTLSQLVFVLLGAAGVPVFSGFSGGLGIISGPTGGFIVGYILCALAAGFCMDKLGHGKISVSVAIAIGWVVTYLCGIPWFMYVTQMPLTAALSMCFIPFIPGDIIKSIICVMLINRLKLIKRV